jgi:hypothetical protein
MTEYPDMRASYAFISRIVVLSLETEAACTDSDQELEAGHPGKSDNRQLVEPKTGRGE